MKNLTKFFVVMFLLANFGVDPPQKLAKYKRWLCVPKKETNRSIANLCN